MEGGGGALIPQPSGAWSEFADLERNSLTAEANGRIDEDDELEVAEVDPSNRYSRYKHEVGKGRFKHVFRGFDERQGIDIAWSKIMQEGNHLDAEQMVRIVEEMSIGLMLDHANIIRCYRCWQDPQRHCINLITEFFTSGNLRDYRQRHKHLGLKAVRKWGRQILQGLDYLHSQKPPVIHGDLRCDKIYINGHSGEIKIGDLGLATLMARRFSSPGKQPPQGAAAGLESQHTQDADVFAFGLCTLELATLKRVDPSNCPSAAELPELLKLVPDEDCRHLIERCLSPENGSRPTARELLEEAFFARKMAHSDSMKQGDLLSAGPSSSSLRNERKSVDESGSVPGDEGVACEVGTVRGEDYNFQFTGKVKDGKLAFRLHMEWEGEEEAGPGGGSPDGGSSRTLDFMYDPDEDTADQIAVEIGQMFNLSTTDRDICAAALKEYLAKEMPQ